MEEQENHCNNYDERGYDHLDCFDDHHFDDGFEDFGQNENLHDITEEPVIANQGDEHHHNHYHHHLHDIIEDPVVAKPGLHRR